jgi:hypothetical protein
MTAVAAKADIPDGLTDSHAQEIEKFLKQALGELQNVDANVKRVTSRLNYSDTDKIIPVWAGRKQRTDSAQGKHSAQKQDAGINCLSHSAQRKATGIVTPVPLQWHLKKNLI